MLVAVGSAGIKGQALLGKVIIPAVLAPALAFVVAGLGIAVVYWLVGRRRPGIVTNGFKLGQIVSGAMLSLAHGTNDAQKTMGVIGLALVAHGTYSPTHFHVPAWVVISAATAIALGTYAGGWRIIRTLGTRIIKMDTAQGFASQGAGAAVILASSHFGYPLSTTQVISGGIVGAGASKHVSAVRWGVAGHIVAAWVLTLPAAGIVGAAAYGVARVFGTGALGPLLISVVLLGVLASVLVARRAGADAPSGQASSPGSGSETVARA
jgi:PiT family inorganic phosphate transporter